MKSVEFISEQSPNTIFGSFTKDLIGSKIWLCNMLKKCYSQPYNNVYILGSWYGNLAFILNKTKIDCDNIICVEIDKNALKTSEKLLTTVYPDDKLTFIHNDAKNLEYDKNGVVINTSVNDMSTDWYENVPKGCIVVVQGRNDLKEPKTVIDNLKKLDKLFPMTEVAYLGSKKFVDPETQYNRYLKIGVK